MRVEYKKVVKVDELAHLVPTRAGATFSQLWQVFYYTRMFKYITYRHYTKIKRSFNKICTYKKLQELCRLGYLKSPQHEVYCATDKVLPILKEAGYIVDTLPVESIGKGDINELNNTDVFVQLTKFEHFYTLIYPNFGFIIPDAFMVQLDRKNSKYKLTFIEIEARKPKWEQYIEKKRYNYLKLARHIDVYNYWKAISTKLGLPCPHIDHFKFSVFFICSLNKKFEIGFKFINYKKND